MDSLAFAQIENFDGVVAERANEQSCAGGILGGSRMQYHLRQSLTSIDAQLFGRPEVFVTFAAQKFDDKTLELKDQTAIDMITQQLAAFEKYIRKIAGKAP